MKKITFTKVIVIVYSIAFMVWVSLSYVLAFMDKYEIAQDLSGNVVTVGIAAIIGYMLKAFFETYSEEKNKLKKSQMNLCESEEEVDLTVEPEGNEEYIA